MYAPAPRYSRCAGPVNTSPAVVAPLGSDRYQVIRAAESLASSDEGMHGESRLRSHLDVQADVW